MKRLALILALCAVALTGCSLIEKTRQVRVGEDGFDPSLVRVPEAVLPNVLVVNGYLVVDQEPIRITRRDVGTDGKVTLSFALPAGSQFRWPPDGAIQIQPVPRAWACIVKGAARRILECRYDYEPRGKFSYTLNALEGDRPLPPLDPTIVNME